MNNLVLLLHFDEAAGSTTIKDSSSNAATFTCTTCPTFGTSGRFGNAMENKSGSTIDLQTPDAAWNRLTGSITISAWINLYQFYSADSYILEKGLNDDDNYSFFIYH